MRVAQSQFYRKVAKIRGRTRGVQKAFEEPETLLHVAALGDGLDIGYTRFDERI